jgi:hypothetical protein
MPVIPARVRRTLVALAALAGLMLSMGQACATPPQGTHGTGSSTKNHGTSSKYKKDKDDDYDQYGYNDAGYDRKGFDKHGYDENGYTSQGYDKNGYDKNGYDRSGYDRNGYDGSGCNRAGYDRDGDKCSSDDHHKSDDDS